MDRKRFLRILFISALSAVIIALLTAGWIFVRRQSLEYAAKKISSDFFNGALPQIDHEKRTVTFVSVSADILKELQSEGDAVFAFSDKIFELPWRPCLQSVSLNKVKWIFDLQKQTLNGMKKEDFISLMQEKIKLFKPEKNAIFPDILTEGTVSLTNQAGAVKELSCRTILRKNEKMTLLGVQSGDMKINFLYNSENEKLIGQYQAARSDFEFFRLSFGLPEIFEMSGVDILSGQFQYDVPLHSIDYIRGSCRFGADSSIRGSIFNIYGSRNGRINWEYLNPQNWHIEFINAVSGKPFRSKMHYFTLSQNTMEQNALSFDGEIEFSSSAFADSFGLELDRRSANIRHHVVGKWDMAQKSWELSRIDVHTRVPQVKLKWNGMDIAFQGRSFKLSGAGAKEDHFGFHYELDMENADLRDSKGNMIIAARAKLEGDCILSLGDDTLKPLLTGSISCGLADGAFENTRFIMKDFLLKFSPDRDERSKYLLSIADLALGIPNLENGWRLELPQIRGEKSSEKTFFSIASAALKYKDAVDIKSRGALILSNASDGSGMELKTSALQGRAGEEEFSADNISGKFIYSDNKWNFKYSFADVKWGGKRLNIDNLSGVVNGGNSDSGFFVSQIGVYPARWKYSDENLNASSSGAALDIFMDENGKVIDRRLSSGQSMFNLKGDEYVIPDITLHEVDRGEYRDGTLKGSGDRCNFDITYTIGKNSDITLKNGTFERLDEVFSGLSGEVDISVDGSLFEADLKYAGFKKSDMLWENGSVVFSADFENGFELNGFDGTIASEMTSVKFSGKNDRGENEFEVKNLPPKYIEKVLMVPEGTFSGLFDGTLSMEKGSFFDPFKIQTFYLKNNVVSRLRLEVLEKYAEIGNSVDDNFAADALKDFFAKSLVLDYHVVGKYFVLNLNAVGKSTELLPYEFDIKEKKLKKSDVALFNSEVELTMKYMLKKP